MSLLVYIPLIAFVILTIGPITASTSEPGASDNGEQLGEQPPINPSEETAEPIKTDNAEELVEPIPIDPNDPSPAALETNDKPEAATEKKTDSATGEMIHRINNKHCYFFHDELKTDEEATLFCKTEYKNSVLVNFETLDELYDLWDEVFINNNNSKYWTDGEFDDEVQYFRWKTGDIVGELLWCKTPLKGEGSGQKVVVDSSKKYCVISQEKEKDKNGFICEQIGCD